jgi:hypothetical protein
MKGSLRFLLGVTDCEAALPKLHAVCTVGGEPTESNSTVPTCGSCPWHSMHLPVVGVSVFEILGAPVEILPTCRPACVLGYELAAGCCGFAFCCPCYGSCSTLGNLLAVAPGVIDADLGPGQEKTQGHGSTGWQS